MILFFVSYRGDAIFWMAGGRHLYSYECIISWSTISHKLQELKFKGLTSLRDSRSLGNPTCVLECAALLLIFTDIRPISRDNLFHIKVPSFGLSSQNIRLLFLGCCCWQYCWTTMEGSTLAHGGRDCHMRLKTKIELFQEKPWACLLMHIPSSSSVVILCTRYTET